MPSSKPSRTIEPKPFWVLVKKRTGEVYPNFSTEAADRGWPGIHPTREKAELAQSRLGSDWMIRKVIPKLEVLNHA